MNNIYFIIHRIYQNRKTNRRLISLFTALSVLAAFILPLAAAFPEPELKSYAVNAGDIPSVYTAPEARFTDISGHITGMTVTSGAGTVTLISNNNYEITPQSGSESVDVDVSLSYHFDQGDALNNILTNRYLYFEIPPNTINITSSVSGSDYYSTDTQYNEYRHNNEPSGYYSISSSGFIVLKLTADYIDYLRTMGALNGIANIKGNIRRDTGEFGTKTATIASGMTIEVDFADKYLTMSKSNYSGRDSNGQFIEWTIQITNPQKCIDMAGWKVSDILNDSAFSFNRSSNSNIFNFSVYPDGCGSIVGDDYIFTSTPDNEYIEIKYRQYGIESGKTYSNTAKLSKQNRDDVTADSSVTIANRIDATKSGMADYQTGVDPNGKIIWKVTLNNVSGDSLKGTYVNDPMINASSELVVRNNGTVINSGYTITDGRITFNSADILSYVEIEYKSNAIRPASNVVNGSVANTNTATIGVDPNINANPPAIPQNQLTATVYYRNEVDIEKDFDDMETDTGKVKWRIAIYSNSLGKQDDNWTRNLDDSNSATVDGYVITDEAFVGMNASDFSYNAYHASGNYNNRYYYNDNNIEITKSSTESNQITIHVLNNAPINYFVMFYSKALDTADQSKYDSGETVNLSNTASVSGDGLTASSTAEKDLKANITANKTYYGIDGNLPSTVMGSKTDTSDRILNWNAELTKENCFKADDVILTDTLEAFNTHGGNATAKHYLTKSQIEAIKLYGQTAHNGTKTEIPPNCYDIVCYDSSNNVISTLTDNSEVKKFVITLNSNYTNFSYKYISLSYKSTAETKDIANGETVYFKNSYHIAEQNDTTIDGMQFIREDPFTQQKMTQLQIYKTWDDGQNMMNSRPAKVRFNVLRAAANSMPADDSDSWKELTDQNGDPKVYEFDVKDGTYGWQQTESFQINEEFPLWEVNADETVTRYYYRIKEIDVANGYTVSYGSDYTYGSNIITANPNGGTCNLTNSFKTHCEKTAVDSENRDLTSIKKSQLEQGTFTINDNGEPKPTQCYIVKWKLMLGLTSEEKKSNDDNVRTFIDTLPPNTYYISGEMSSAYHATLGQVNGNYTLDIIELNYGGTLTQNGRTLTYVASSQTVDYLVYYTATPVDKLDTALDENGKLVNTAIKYTDRETPSVASVAELEITNSNDPPPSPELLDKSYERSITPGKLIYKLDINPDGRILSHEGTLDITDALTVDAGSSKTADQLAFDVEVYVYPYNEDGTVSRTPIPKSQYSYRVEKNAVVRTDVPVSAWEYDANSKILSTEQFVPGSEMHLTIHYPHYSQYSDPNLQSKIEQPYQACTINYDSQLSDEQHNLDLTLQIPNASGNKLCLESYGTNFEIVSSYYEETIPVLLHINVPDGQHYHIEYVYNVSGYATGDTIKFTNKAQFQTDNAEGYAECRQSAMNTQSSSMQTSTDTYPMIYKVDVNNEGNNDLCATFKVAKYVSGNWIYANNVSAVTIQDSDAYRSLDFTSGLTESDNKVPNGSYNVIIGGTDNPSSADREDAHKFALEKGALYKFVEIISPVGNYASPNWNENTDLTTMSDFIYYFTYDGYDAGTYGTMPSNIDYTNIHNSGRINIKNSQLISISAEKQFTGTSEQIPSSAEVVLELLWSVSNNINNAVPVTANDLNLGSQFTTNEQTIQYPTNKKVYWSGLPSGKDGSPIFYFVREKSYTIGGVTYTRQSDGKYKNDDGTEGLFHPIYTRNGTNTNGTEIEVNNISGIIVEKQWRDLNGDTINAPTEPNSNTPMAIAFTVKGRKSDGTEVTFNLGSGAVLNAGNNYQYQLDFPITGTDGHSYNESDFIQLTVEENLTETQQTALDGKYKDPPDYLSRIENGCGKLTIINTSLATDKVAPSVEMIWSDGAGEHTNDKVYVKLIRTTTELTPEGLSELGAGGYEFVDEKVLSNANDWKYTWNDQPAADGNDNEYHYYVIETTSVNGYDESYSVSGQKTTITNTLKTIPKIDIKVKKDGQTMK